MTKNQITATFQTMIDDPKISSIDCGEFRRKHKSVLTAEHSCDVIEKSFRETKNALRDLIDATYKYGLI